jgi:hypothetical protein
MSLDERVAFHEAGHAVVALAYGLPLVGICPVSGGDRLFECRLGIVTKQHILMLGQGSISAGKHREAEVYAIIALSGMAAVKILTGSGVIAVEGASEDWEIAKGHHQRLQDAQGVECVTLNELYTCAEFLVTQNVDAIRKVAAAIQRDGKVTGEDIGAIVASCVTKDSQ